MGWKRLRDQLETSEPMTIQTPKIEPNSLRQGPDAHGHFGIFGGRFVAETLMPLILAL